MRAKSWVPTAVLGLLLVLGWLFLAPPNLGGSTNYVVLQGSSMEPKLHSGDLVLVRSSDDYAVGDVAAYRNERLGRVILHRVEGREGGELVFKGDANDWIDPDKIAESEVIGEQWLRIPGAGSVLGVVRSPLVLAALGGLFAGLLAYRFARRRGMAPASVVSYVASVVTRPVMFRLVGGAAVVMLALALYAFTMPATHTSSSKAAFSHHGRFSYSADAPAGPVYPAGKVVSGDPVFLRLVDDVFVGFSYRFRALAGSEVTGTGRLTAELSDDSGWTYELPLSGSQTLAGDKLEMAGRLDLDDVAEVILDFETQTGLDKSVYGLTIAPSVEVEGQVAGAALHSTFAPRLDFQIDELHLSLASNEGAGGTGSNDLAPTETSRVDVAGSARTTFTLLGMRVDAGAARRDWLLAAIMLAAATYGVRDRRPKVAQPAMQDPRYARLLVPVHLNGARDLTPRIEVPSMEALARLADQYDRVIMHESRVDGSSYLVEGGGFLYEHRDTEARSSSGGDASPPSGHDES